MIPLRPPPECKRGPKWWQVLFNGLRKFCIEGQIYSITDSGVTASEIMRTPNGILLKIAPGGGTPATYYVVINGTLYTQQFIVKGTPTEV